MKKKIIILFVLLFCMKFVQAQKMVEKNNKKIKSYLKTARKQTSLDSAEFLVSKAINLANQIRQDSLITGTYYNKPLLAAIFGNFDKTLDYLKEFDSVLDLHYRPYYDFRRHTLYAYAYAMEDNMNLSLKHNLKSLELAIKQKDSAALADAYNNIGNAYKDLGKQQKAYKYLNLAKKMNIKLHGNASYINYNNLSQVANNFREARKFSDSAYVLLDKANLKEVSLYYVIRSDAFLNLAHYDESLKAAKKALILSDSIKYEMIKDQAVFYLGKNYYFLNQPDSAIYFLQKVLTKQDLPLNNKKEISRMLALAYETKKHFADALKYHKMYSRYGDSLKTTKAEHQYAEFDAKYEAEKRKKQLAEKELRLTQQKSHYHKVLAISFSGFLILLSLSQWFFYRQKKRQIHAVNALEKEKEINEMRTRFLGNIAHEIRTPMTLIIGNLEMAKENMISKKKLTQFLETALIHTKKVIAEANDILEMLKSDQQQQQLKFQKFSLHETINRIVLSFKSLMDIKHIKLVFNNRITKEIWVKTDLNKLEKILNNLLSNAIKYSDANSQIIVNTGFENGLLKFEIQDFGVGITSGELDKIFIRFYQISDNKSVGGIGIGLALAQNFAKQLQGEIKVFSQQGKGSLFILTIPVEPVKAMNRQITDPVEQSNSNKSLRKKKVVEVHNENKQTVLIVEDNPEMNEFLAGILCPHFNCLRAFDGEEALNLLKTEKVDIITSDVMMPKMDGMAFLKKLKENKSWGYIPVIMITAKSLDENKIEAFKLGINDYIIKPFSKNELLARIKNLLKTKSDWERWLFKDKKLVDNNANTYEQDFIKKVEEIVFNNLSDENFKVADLAAKIGYSQRQLTRLIKKYTGLSPVKFILELRLQKAYAYLKTGQYTNLTDIRFKIGLNSTSYFNKAFKQRFGIYPRDLTT